MRRVVLSTLLCFDCISLRLSGPPSMQSQKSYTALTGQQDEALYKRSILPKPYKTAGHLTKLHAW